MNEFGLPRRFENVEAGEADRQIEAARSGAAGIDVEDPIAPVGVGFVRVAADYDLKTCGLRA